MAGSEWVSEKWVGDRRSVESLSFGFHLCALLCKMT